MIKFIKSELSGWGKYERIIFPLEILLIIGISFYIGDDKIALISAVCGISYTILAGKGKISCFLFGLCGTLCYSYLAFKNGFWGNFALYMFYYFPMEIVGIFKWRNHLKPDTGEIVKTKLVKRERYLYFVSAVVFSVITGMVLKYAGGSNYWLDAPCTVLSIFGLILTVRRCVEQWYIWIIVNGISTIMWIMAYINGSNCFATILMWATYFILAWYFLYIWRNETASND